MDAHLDFATNGTRIAERRSREERCVALCTERALRTRSNSKSRDDTLYNKVAAETRFVEKRPVRELCDNTDGGCRSIVDVVLLRTPPTENPSVTVERTRSMSRKSKTRIADRSRPVKLLENTPPRPAFDFQALPSSALARSAVNVEPIESLVELKKYAEQIRDRVRRFASKNPSGDKFDEKFERNWIQRELSTKVPTTEKWVNSNLMGEQWVSDENDLPTHSSPDLYRRFMARLVALGDDEDAVCFTEHDTVYPDDVIIWARGECIAEFLARIEHSFGQLPGPVFRHWLTRSIPRRFVGYHALLEYCFNRELDENHGRLCILRRLMEFSTRVGRASVLCDKWPTGVNPRTWFLLATTEVSVTDNTAREEARTRAKFWPTVSIELKMIDGSCTSLSSQGPDKVPLPKLMEFHMPDENHDGPFFTDFMLSKYMERTNSLTKIFDVDMKFQALSVMEYWVRFTEDGFAAINLGWTVVSILERLSFKLWLLPKEFSTKFTQAFEIRELIHENPENPDFHATLVRIDHFYSTEPQFSGITDLKVNFYSLRRTFENLLLCFVMREFRPDLSLLECDRSLLPQDSEYYEPKVDVAPALPKSGKWYDSESSEAESDCVIIDEGRGSGVETTGSCSTRQSSTRIPRFVQPLREAVRLPRMRIVSSSDASVTESNAEISRMQESRPPAYRSNSPARPTCLTTEEPTSVLTIGLSQHSFSVQLHGPILFAVLNSICCINRLCPSYQSKPSAKPQVMASEMVEQVGGAWQQEYMISVAKMVFKFRPNVVRVCGSDEFSADALPKLRDLFPLIDIEKVSFSDRRWSRN